MSLKRIVSVQEMRQVGNTLIVPPAKAEVPAPLPPTGRPGLSATANVSELLAVVRRDPGAIKTVLSECERIHFALCANPHLPSPELGVATFWSRVRFCVQQAMPRLQVGGVVDHAADAAAMAEALRIAIDARTLLAGLMADIPRLHHGEMLAIRGLVSASDCAAPIAEAEARLPGFAAWQQRRRETTAALVAQQEEHAARLASVPSEHLRLAQRDAAVAVLRRVLESGVRILLQDGKLLAQPAALLNPIDLADMADHADEIKLLLGETPQAIA